MSSLSIVLLLLFSSLARWFVSFSVVHFSKYRTCTYVVRRVRPVTNWFRVLALLYTATAHDQSNREDTEQISLHSPLYPLTFFILHATFRL